MAPPLLTIEMAAILAFTPSALLSAVTGLRVEARSLEKGVAKTLITA